MTERRCKYVLCTYGRDPLEIDIHDYSDPYDDVYLTYWIRVFQQFEAMSSVNGLTFYIVLDHRVIPDLPSYGNKVVALLLIDEFCLVPHYLGQVRFVFKTYGFRPWISPTLRGKNPITLLKFARDCGRWAYHSAVFLRENGLAASRRAGMVVPLGYARQTDVPVKPFETRRFAISFLRSIEQKRFGSWSPQALLGTPKSIARSRMAQSLQKLAATMPNEVFFGKTGSFAESILSSGAPYSELMADTRICLAPRGSSVETYRLFEALRQGCVVICDRLPPHWFYEGSPVIQIDDWRDLESEVKALLADPERLLALHRQSLAWWEAECSERAVARVFAESLGLASRLEAAGKLPAAAPS